MKQLLFLLTIAAALVTGNATAQSVDEVISGSIEATGGLSNWKNLKSMKSSGKMMQGGMEFPLTVSQKWPDKTRNEIEIQGTKIIQAYDGQVAWTVNPMMQITEPRQLSEEEAASFAGKSIENEFIDYKAKGHSAVLEESESVNGIDCHKVKFTKKDGSIEYHFFDKATYIPLMVRVIAPEGPMAGQPIESHLEDYDAVGDFFMPFTMSTKVGGQTMMQVKIDSYEMNVDMPDSVFAMPGK